MDRKKLRKNISKSLFTYETEYGKKCVDDIMHFVDEYLTEQLRIGGKDV